MSEDTTTLSRRLPAEIPNVISGEIVRTNDITGMARYLQEIREHESRLRELKRSIEGVILDHAREQGTKTLHLQGIDAKVTGGPKVVWDVEKLEELLPAGLPYERFNQMVSIVQETKVNATVANSIASSNPRYREIVEAAKSYEPAPERVTIVS